MRRGRLMLSKIQQQAGDQDSSGDERPCSRYNTLIHVESGNIQNECSFSACDHVKVLQSGRRTLGLCQIVRHSRVERTEKSKS